MEGRIYKITNQVNGKFYVGKTMKSLPTRFYNHCYDAINRNSTSYFHRAIRKYGKENFIIEEKLGNINLHYKEFNEIYKNDIEKLFYKEFNFCDCNDCKKPNLNLNLNINENNENINGNNQNNIIWNSDYNDSSSEYDSD